MKKILFTALLSCVAIGVYAQGQVQFRTYVPSTTPVIDAKVSLESGMALDNSNTEWRAALLGGPTTLTAANVPGSYVGAGATAVLGTLPVLWNPATTTLTWVNFRAAPNAGYVSVVGVSREVEGVNWGGSALIQMVAWQGPYTDWASAFAAWNSGAANVLIGASNPLTLTLPTSPIDPNLSYLIGLSAFRIVPVPEPTTFALAGLGAAALLIFRRRN